MNEKGIIGKKGEDIAFEYLKSIGFTIVERNYREKFGEIDIVAKYNNMIVFIEVKTIAIRNNNQWLEPEDNMTESKIKKLRKICNSYANGNKKIINDREGWRIDLVAIKLKINNIEEVDKLTIKNKDCIIIKHYKNIA